MKKYLIFLGIIIAGFALAAQINVQQGGTGRVDVPVTGYLYGNDLNKLLSTSSPTFGWITATTTGTGSILQTLTILGNLGIATSSPGQSLGVGGFGYIKGNWNVAATSSVSSIIATSTLSIGTSTPLTNNRVTVDGSILVAGKLETQGKPPIVSSCGTSPSIVGNDQAGKVTIGSSPGTSCTLTFDTVWLNAPACFSSDETSAILTRAGTTVSVLTINGVFTGGDVVAYGCIGLK